MNFKSKLENCYIVPREGDCTFLYEDGKVLACLDGYVIMPIEKFQELVGAEYQFVPCTEQTK